MGKKPTLLLLIAVVIICVPLTSSMAGTGYLQTSENEHYFPETGHWLEGDFLQAYYSVPDPVKLYGYPITDAFQNLTTGLTVQYFEKARFELHPNSRDLRVRLTLLGEATYKPGEGQPLPIPENFPACRTFPETGHQVCYAFLDFFEDNGGIAQFGYPISEIEIHGDRMVQYFQRACFEWRPDLPDGDRVQLTDLGRKYFYLIKENPEELRPNRERYIPQSILYIQQRAFVTSSVMPALGQQTLYVIVQDQNMLPIQNAQVTAIVHYPSGKEARYLMDLTDESGITSVQFWVDEETYGTATINITANYDDFEGQTRTSFRIWW